jgi:hypothetical protein
MVSPIFRPLPSARVDPAILRGWGSRAYDWEFSTEIEQQVNSQLAATIGFFRRWYGNFIAQDNAATTASDYSRWSFTAPVDPRLPNGGGYVVDNLYDLNPDKVGVVDKYYTFADHYGKSIEHWNGVDIGVNTRLGSGILLRGGISTGRTVTDNCELLAKSPEIVSSTSPPSAGGSITTTPAGVPYCHQNSGFLTQYKGFGSYTVPKANVQVSVNFQNFLGPTINANINVPTATAATTLGRPLAGGASNATVNLVAPTTVYLPRVNQLDLKLAKRMQYGKARASVSLDVFNLFNVSPMLTANQNYAAWQTPLSILQARFAKIGVQFDY